MATQTLAAADAALQDHFVEPIVRATKDKKYLLDRVKRDSKKIDARGRKAVWSIHNKRNRGRASHGTTEGGILPAAGRQGFEDAECKITYHFYAMEITDAAIEATAGSEDAFVDLLEEETTGVARDMGMEMNRMAWGDGTGLLAKVTASSSGTTITVDNPQWLEVGDPLTVCKVADGTSAVAREIQSINYTAKTVVVNTATTVDNTYGLYVAGNRNNETNGVRNLINKDRQIHNVPTDVAQFQSRVVDLAGATAGESSFQLLRDSINRRGFGRVDEFLTTLGVRRRLANTYVSQKRYNDAGAVKIHAGYSAIYVDETPVIADEDGQKGEVVALAPDALTWFEQAPPDWLKQKDGSVFQLKDSTTPGYKEATWQAWFKWYANLASQLPARGGRLTNCADDDYEGA